jgi:hypothetical protein
MKNLRDLIKTHLKEIFLSLLIIIIIISIIVVFIRDL